MLLRTQLTNNIFHNHNCAIDDQSKIDRTKTHQISGNAKSRHTRDREKECQWNRSCDDERGAPVSKEEKQHRDDKQRAFEKIRSHGANSAVHQILSVVLRTNDHAGWQLLLNFPNFCGNALRYSVTVLAH